MSVITNKRVKCEYLQHKVFTLGLFQGQLLSELKQHMTMYVRLVTYINHSFSTVLHQNYNKFHIYRVGFLVHVLHTTWFFTCYDLRKKTVKGHSTTKRDFPLSPVKTMLKGDIFIPWWHTIYLCLISLICSLVCVTVYFY